jgi:DNA-binding CsgD family transcriptional regulator
MGLVETFIELSNTAKSQEEVFEHFRNALAKLGFDSIVYSLLTDHASLKRKAGHGVMCNYPSDWMRYYMERSYQKYDPVIHHAFKTASPYTWKELLDSATLPKIGRTILNESREAKLLDGAAVAIYGPNFEVSGVGIASTTGAVNPDRNTLCVVRALANQFHCAYSALDSNHTEPRVQYIPLTARETEILLWSAEGKSVTSIAAILSISENSVKFHLKNIYRKLDVTDRLQAVVKAIFLGLINPANIRNLQLLPIPA